MDHEPELPELSSLEGELLGGKYVAESVLGRGGMGIVFCARQVDGGPPVAIKVLRQELVGSEEAVARFDREARASVSLQSAHVARIFDVGRTSAGAPFIVMEHLIGRSLSAIVAEHTLDPATVVDLALEVCDALTEAHARGIIHRDLKPANVFVVEAPDGSRSAKVLDFGIAKVDGTTFGGQSLTTTGSMIGTPWYMPPEQLDTRFGVTPKADVWSLGATLYNALTGRTPYEAESFFELSVKVYTHEPTPIERHRGDLPPDLVALVHGCLQKDVTKRLALADVVERLKHLQASHRPAETAPPTRRQVSSMTAPITPTLLAPVMASTAPSSATMRMTPQPDARARQAHALARTAVLLGGASGVSPVVAPAASFPVAPVRIGAVIALAAAVAIAGILLVVRLRHSPSDPATAPGATSEPASPTAASSATAVASAPAPVTSTPLATPSSSQAAVVTPRPTVKRPTVRPPPPPSTKPDPGASSGGALTHER